MADEDTPEQAGEPASEPTDSPAAELIEEPAAERLLPRRDAMALRLVAVAVTLVLAIAVAFIVVVLTGPPSVDDLREQAGLDGKQELLIGVKNDQPGVAEFRNGVWSGFDIEIAYMIAADLGFRRSEIRFLAIESEDRARMQATDANHNRVGVDMVIASYSRTPEREKTPGVLFSAPYLFTEQSVLTRPDHAQVSALEDLKGQKVCTLAASTSESPARQVGVDLLTRKTMTECINGLDSKEYDAITTDATILAGFKARFPKKYTHWDIGLDKIEAYAVNVGENKALQQLVNLTLYRSRQDPEDNRWEDAFDRTFKPEEQVNLPAPIAVDQQPAVPPAEVPQIRQWPWERV